MYSPYQMYQPMPAHQEVVKVSGENGARAYQMAPNSSALLLDETAPIVWLKTTDGAGYPCITPYMIEPVKQEAPIDVAGLEARLSKIEEELYGKSNDGEAGAK